RFPAYWGTIERLDARTCRYRTGDDDLGWLALRIAMLGVDFEVHEPPGLVEHLRVLSDRLGRAARVRAARSWSGRALGHRRSPWNQGDQAISPRDDPLTMSSSAPGGLSCKFANEEARDGKDRRNRVRFARWGHGGSRWGRGLQARRLDLRNRAGRRR